MSQDFLWEFTVIFTFVYFLFCDLDIELGHIEISIIFPSIIQPYCWPLAIAD